MERYLTWNELNEEERYQAARNYYDIMLNTENEDFSGWEEAKEMAPFCKGYWVTQTEYGPYVECNI